jgi:UDP-N-acetylmuramyl pentapeptide synthase
MLVENLKVLERILKPRRICNAYQFTPIKGFSIDSRTINKGEAFIALKGKYHDGHRFIRDAAERGAALIIYEECCPLDLKVPFF